MQGVIIAGAIVGLILLMSRRASASGGADTLGPIEDGETSVDDPKQPELEKAPDGESIRKKVGDGLAKIGIKIEIPPTVEIPKRDLLPLDPTPPRVGATPSDPLPSSALWPGFVGYFQVQTGDNLSKLGGRLGVGWRDVRDDPANAWAVEQCPRAMQDKYYGGEDGIGLTQNYGKTPGLDCAAPGWSGKYYKYKKPLTGQFPVLGWKVDEV